MAAADKLLAEVRERNKGFLDQALAALGNTITTFLELKAKLESAFAAAKDVVLQILADPITFAKNLFAGIVQGFKNFGKNILSHLGQGVIEWLTGAVSEAGIVLPDKFDTDGLLSILLQITGLSVAHVKERARKVWGDKAVDLIEKVVSGVQKGVAGIEKAVEFYEVLRAEGVMGLVRLLREKIIALKDQALDSIKNALAIEVIAAAIQNLLSMLTPASALVQAVIKIVNVVLWFIQNASRISELVTTIANGARDVLAGNISGLAAKVEKALASTIPIVIDFFAALIGVGRRIVETIKKAIAFVRGAVDEAIDAVLAYLKGLFERVMTALGFGPKEKPKPEGEEGPHAEGAGAIGISAPFTLAGESHELFIQETATDARLMVRSAPQPFDSFANSQAVIDTGDPTKINEVKGRGRETQKAAREAKEKQHQESQAPAQLGTPAAPAAGNVGAAGAANATVISDENALIAALQALTPADMSVEKKFEKELASMAPGSRAYAVDQLKANKDVAKADWAAAKEWLKQQQGFQYVLGENSRVGRDDTAPRAKAGALIAVEKAEGEPTDATKIVNHSKPKVRESSEYYGGFHKALVSYAFNVSEAGNAEAVAATTYDIRTCDDTQFVLYKIPADAEELISRYDSIVLPLIHEKRVAGNAEGLRNQFQGMVKARNSVFAGGFKTQMQQILKSAEQVRAERYPQLSGVEIRLEGGRRADYTERQRPEATAAHYVHEVKNWSGFAQKPEEQQVEILTKFLNQAVAYLQDERSKNGEYVIGGLVVEIKGGIPSGALALKPRLIELAAEKKKHFEMKEI